MKGIITAIVILGSAQNHNHLVFSLDHPEFELGFDRTWQRTTKITG